MKKILTFLLAALTGFYASAESLALYPDAATTSTYLPLNIYYCSNNIHTQMIYPAKDLEQLKGKVIDKISFTITRAGGLWKAPAISLKMGTTEQSAYESTTYITSGLTEVASIANLEMPVPSTFPYTWEITLDAPFTYTGDNLLLDFTNDKGTGPRNWTFIGQAQDQATGISMTGSARLEKFLPSITFEYSETASASATLSSSVINFADFIFVGQQETASVRLTNSGVESLTGSVEIEGNGFSVSPSVIDNLLPGDAMDLIVTFEPESAGNFNSMLTFKLNDLDPMAVALSGIGVDGPEAMRTLFNEGYYTQIAPAGWNTYAEEFLTQTLEFSAGSTEYDDFGTALRFESAQVAGVNALLWNHANPMPFSDLYTRAYYLVSPEVGGDVTFGATLNDVPATGAFVKAYSATYDPVRHIFNLGNELELTWNEPLQQGKWATATTTTPASTNVAFLLKYAALGYFAADNKTSGINEIQITPENSTDTPVQYYNLQGIKIDRAAKGVCIMVKGNKATKVVIP